MTWLAAVTFLRSPRAFPTAIIALQIGAMARWAAAGSLKQTLYWFFATGLVATMTFVADMP